MSKYVGAIDQGTTSTRFMVFDRSGAVVAVDHREHEQIYRRPGWVEHDAMQIVARCREVIRWASDRVWQPAMDPARREQEYRRWKKAVTRTFDWQE